MLPPLDVTGTSSSDNVPYLFRQVHHLCMTGAPFVYVEEEYCEVSAPRTTFNPICYDGH